MSHTSMLHDAITYPRQAPTQLQFSERVQIQQHYTCQVHSGITLGDVYSNITHDRYTLVLPWEMSTATLHMTGTRWYYLGRCQQQFRSKHPSRTTVQLCKIQYSNITKHSIGGTSYLWVICSKAHRGYMNPRIIPNTA